MNRRLVRIAVVVGVGAFATPAMAAGLAAPAIAKPPVPVDTTPFTFPEGTACPDFAVTGVLAGKGKLIDLGDGRTIVTSPGQKITLTNDDTHKTVSYVITGTFHNQVINAQGDVQTMATGRNALTDSGTFVLTSGNFSFVNDKDGNNVTPLSGKGKITNICDALS
jgi:hypothetical protein